MKPTLIIVILLFTSFSTRAQKLGDFAILDQFSSASHPISCDDKYVNQPPDSLIWVNFFAGDTVVGTFGSTWSDEGGPDLLLETGFHPDNYELRLIFSNGNFSDKYEVSAVDWTQIDDILWDYKFRNCDNGKQVSSRYILPLDFVEHFDLATSDLVKGLEVVFKATGGAPDLAGAYIIRGACESDTTSSSLKFCKGETLSLKASHEKSTYQWQDGNTNASIQIAQAGTYWVKNFHDSCTSIDTFRVVEYETGKPELGRDTLLCEGDTMILDASNQWDEVHWSDGSTLTKLKVTESGSYRVSVKSGPCWLSDTTHVNFEAKPEIDLGPDTTICYGDQILLDASWFNTEYRWSNSLTTSSQTVGMPGTYWVDVFGCETVSDTITIDSSTCKCYMVMPNSFSLNGDGLNEDFGPVFDCELEIKEYRLSIYDRWGARIFYSTSPILKWNGQIKDKPVPPGVYAYLLEYREGFNHSRKSGVVHVLR